MREQFDDMYEEEDSGIIPIFPDEDDYEPSAPSVSDSDDDDEAPVKLTFGHIERAAKQAVDQMAAEDASDSDDDDDDDDDDDGEAVSLSFAKAAKKEKEFIFMPFLNIEEDDDDYDEEDGEEVSLSFAKTEKKEKDFIFMPFLNIDEDSDDDDDGRRSSDDDDDDLVIIPLPDADETYNSLFRKEEDEGADGISVVGGDIAPMPKKKKRSSGPQKPSSAGSSKKHSGAKRPNASRSGSTKPRQGQKSSQAKSSLGYGKKSSSSSKKPSHSEQFQRAMRNVNPEILAAVKHDPVQRAALEQAIRIALVQYAAQEAVAKSKGRIGLDMLAYQKPSSNGGKRPPSGKKSGKKKSNAQRSRMPGSNMSRSMPRTRSASNSGARSLNQLDLTPVELGSGSSGHGQPHKSASGNTPAQQQLLQQQTQQQAAAQQSQQQPAQQTQQPVQHQNRHITPNSPAAIKAAMRAGLDLSGNQPSAQKTAAATTAPLTPQQRAQAQANAAAAANRSGCLVGIIAIFVVFFVAMIAFFIIPVAKQREQYNTAINNMSEGNYASALRLLEDMSDYEDAPELIKECRYNLGVQYQTKGDYESAIKQFEQVLTYQDASSKIVECKYMHGKSLFTAGNYRDAYDLFRDIASYSDAADFARESNYNYITSVYDHAEEKYAEGDIEAALSDYIEALGAYDNIENFRDYLDSYSRWQIMQYKCASVMFEAGKAGASIQLEQAAKLFRELEDYNDSELQFALAQYELIKLDKYESFTLKDLVFGMNTIAEQKPDGYAAMLSSPAYAGAKLVGTWTSGDFSFTVTVGEETDTLTFELPGDWRDTDVVVTFSGSSVLITRDGEQLEVMNVTEFTPADSEAPQTAKVFCTDTAEILTFTKG
ncbi:MAG: tetratricopeptide repeat protein [Clostridia bacterium]|nr:tetratricopeptide repeat protein [Clostridia bacterium]